MSTLRRRECPSGRREPAGACSGPDSWPTRRKRPSLDRTSKFQSNDLKRVIIKRNRLEIRHLFTIMRKLFVNLTKFPYTID